MIDDLDPPQEAWTQDDTAMCVLAAFFVLLGLGAWVFG